jgi:hypothetical protein
MSRVRLKEGGAVTGSYSRFGQVYQQSASMSYDKCTDEVLPGDGYHLLVEHYQANGGIVNSLYNPGVNGRYPLGWPCYALASQRYRGHLSTGSPSNATLAATLLARTNPSRPSVDLPVFIAELKDLPELFYLQGKSIIKKAASANLMYQFGWKPLLSDIAKMYDFTTLMNKRIARLNKLKKHGLKCTIPLGSFNAKSQTTDAVETFVNFIDRPITRETVEQVTGFVRYFPSPDFPSSEAGIVELARKTTLGLTVDASTVWELIPWSWFVDYFTNIGDYLSAHRNIVPCTHSIPQIMRHTITKSYDTGKLFNPPGEPWMYYTNLSCTHETKSRDIANASIGAHLPFLTDGQLSILGSLSVLKGR